MDATPRVLIEAFFDSALLMKWRQTLGSVTIPRALGVYALEWVASESPDPVLGRLGGTFHGTILTFEATRGFFVANAFWLPPDSDPIGPMALDVTCTMSLTADGRPATKLRVAQTGFENSVRWRRYYELAQNDWLQQLAALKTLLEP